MTFCQPQRQHRLRNVRRLIKFFRNRAQQAQPENPGGKAAGNNTRKAGNAEDSEGIFDRNRREDTAR